MKNKMKVEVWSDIMCPFCYIGKRHYEAAIKEFANSQNIELIWKSYQLDPEIPEKIESRVDVYQYLADRKGISYDQSVQMHKRVLEMADAAGLHYNLDKLVVANSFKAHRVIQFAKTKGLGDMAEEVFFEAYFINGKDLADDKTLAELGEKIGLSESDVQEALTNDEYAYTVKQDIMESQQIGVTGVPFFVFNRRYGISGAQPVEAFVQTLNQSFEEWRKENPEIKIEVQNGPSCTPDGHCD